LTALGGSESTDGSLRAEVVEFADLDALKSAPDGSLVGKIAFVNLKMKRAKDGSGYGPVSNVRRSGASEAARKGATALLIRSVGTDSDRLPHTGMMKYDDGVAKPSTTSSVKSPDAASPMKWSLSAAIWIHGIWVRAPSTTAPVSPSLWPLVHLSVTSSRLRNAPSA
jgi:hypothetical protein